MRIRLLLAFKGSFLYVSLLFLSLFNAHGQVTPYSYFYRVYLKDKGTNTSNHRLSDLFTERAIQRRIKAGIISIDIVDIPVNKTYLQEIASRGFNLHCTSRWMNTALFKTRTPGNISLISSLPFVKEVRIVKTPGIKSNFRNKLDFETVQSGQNYDAPIIQLNGYALHNSGYSGRGILIAILDGGFTNADIINSLTPLRDRKGIKGTRDFVNNKSMIYNSSSHGTAVLTVLAGDLKGLIAGTAPNSDYLLLKTEDVETEFPCEEDFWAAGAEYADSSGADVISSSLGYNSFDDPSMNYKKSDLDGHTAFVTIAASIAASRGIFVVNSAGNERDNQWRKIIFPADASKVLAAGAVNETGSIAYFSSAGPTSDLRIKPDNCAMGIAVPVQTIPGSISKANGTSFSCPVLSGMVACLIKAVPKASVDALLESIHKSGDRYNHPDSLYGYGIPDMGVALTILQERYLPVTTSELLVYPNPTMGSFDIVFRNAPASIKIDIFTINGKIVFTKEFPKFTGRELKVDELQKWSQGIYFVRVTDDKSVILQKIIKIDGP